MIAGNGVFVCSSEGDPVVQITKTCVSETCIPKLTCPNNKNVCL